MHNISILHVFCADADADAAAAVSDSYSRIDQVAPSLSSATVAHVTNPSALYAVVSRNRTAPSQTNPVRVASSSIDSADTVTVDARRDLYTRVIRRQDGRRPTASSSQSQSLSMEPSRSVGMSADGYARIDEPPRQQQQQNYNNNSVDFYDVIRDDLSVTTSSDFDPNYESVPQTTAAAVSGSAAAASSSVNGVAGSGGQQGQDTVVTASDTGGGRQNEPARHQSLLIREHIYDEVSSPTTRCSTTITHSDV